MICSSVCLLRFIVWSFLKARLQFTLDQFNGATSAVTKDLGLSEDVVNVEGGAIAHGHPIGATGAVLTTRLLHSMQRDGIKRGVVTLCIGGGQGIALALETVK